MELNRAVLDAIIGSCPGDFAVYRVAENRLATVYYSPGLPGLCDMTAEEYDRIISRDAADIVLPADRPRVASLVQKLAGGQSEVDFTYRIRHKSRDFVWIHARVRIIGTMEGCPVVMALFLNNSAETEEHARLLNETDTIVYVLDLNTRELLYANDPALREWGHGDYSGQPCYRYINGLDEPCPWCLLPKIENGSAHQDACYQPRIGKWFRLDCREMNWFGRKAAAVFAMDVTEQTRRQKDLEIDRAGLEAIVQNLPVGVGVCRIRGGKVSTAVINPLIRQLLGIRAEQFSATDGALLDHVHPDDRAAILHTMAACCRPDVQVRQDYRFDRDGQGSYRWYRLEGRTLPQEDGTMLFSCLSDVTAERTAAQEVLHSRQMYESAVEEARLVVWEYDLAARRVTMSEGAFTSRDSRKFDLPPVIENVPDSLLPYIAQEDQEKFLQLYRDVAAGAARTSCDVWYRLRPGQEPRCEHISYTTVFSESGQPVRAYGIGQNITARKLEEASYRRMYQQLAEVNPSSIAVFRLNLTANRCGEGQSKYPRVLAMQDSGTADGLIEAIASNIADETAARQFRALFDRERLLAEFQAGHVNLTMEYPVLSQSGERMWLMGYLHMVQNPHTGEIEAVANAVDITDRRKDEDMIRYLAEHRFDYLGLLDLRAGTIEFRHRQSDISFGGLRRRMGYGSWRDYVVARFLPPEEVDYYLQGTDPETIRRRLEVEETYTFSFRSRDGRRESRRQIQYSWLNRELGEVLLIRTDVTAAYRLEQDRLRQTQEALAAAQSANRAKTEFLSRISHDIRTPISIISSMTDFALEDLSDPEKLRDDLTKIKSADTFLLSLINDVLDISKIDSGKIQLNPEPYPFDEYISNIRNTLEPLCQQKGLHFVVERRRKTGTIVADKIRLNQIALNLLSNAVKYTPSGGTVTYVSDSEDLPDGTIRHVMEIRDTGIGMSAAFQKQMFQPFSQEYDNPARPKAESGTGLGLSIVKRIADLMGSTLTVQSAPGKGTSIRCTTIFPCAENDPRFCSSARPQPEPEAPPVPLRGKVLLAEDNPINTQIAVRLLTSFGLEVDCAADGRQAADCFASSAPGEYRAVLMDLQMPVLNGYEAAAAIRAMSRPDARTVPIYAMTADAFSEAIERCRKAGMDGHITKPLHPKLLRSLLGKEEHHRE